MRRIRHATGLLALTTALLLGVGAAAPAGALDLTGAAPASAAPEAPAQPVRTDADADAETIGALGIPSDVLAREAVTADPADVLDVAARVRAGKGGATDPSVSLAMRDLYLARPDLSGSALDKADTLLARPTDGTSGGYPYAYTVPEATPVCGTNVCVHYVTSTPDAATPAWVATTLGVMEEVYAGTTAMGFLPPSADGLRGGDSRLDVYLKDFKAKSPGVYGFCSAEDPKPLPATYTSAAGYCVLDNDFAPEEYGGQAAWNSLRVTAAHEFFHAVQYTYDVGEDRWFMESTATWMEERLYNDVNDNRQYLRVSQMAAPYIPLDTYAAGAHYGNWIFWEYLSTRFGTDIVRKVWTKAGNGPKARKTYSMKAIRKVLGKKKFPKVYGDFIASLTEPATYFPEGAAYAPLASSVKRLKRGRTWKQTFRPRRLEGRPLGHLTGRTYRVLPGRNVKKKGRLLVRVNGPRKVSSPAATVLVHYRNGTIKRKSVTFDKRGRARAKVAFGKKKVSWVTVSLANASTRYTRCGTVALFACQGLSKDDKHRFDLRLTAVR